MHLRIRWGLASAGLLFNGGKASRVEGRRRSSSNRAAEDTVNSRHCHHHPGASKVQAPRLVWCGWPRHSPDPYSKSSVTADSILKLEAGCTRLDMLFLFLNLNYYTTKKIA